MTKPWHDCPPCPKCGLHGVTKHLYFGRMAPSQLACAGCGVIWDCTPEERAQAERADAAWEREQEIQAAAGPLYDAIKLHMRAHGGDPDRRLDLGSPELEAAIASMGGLEDAIRELVTRAHEGGKAAERAVSAPVHDRCHVCITCGRAWGGDCDNGRLPPLEPSS